MTTSLSGNRRPLLSRAGLFGRPDMDPRSGQPWRLPSSRETSPAEALLEGQAPETGLVWL